MQPGVSNCSVASEKSDKTNPAPGAEGTVYRRAIQQQSINVEWHKRCGVRGLFRTAVIFLVYTNISMDAVDQ